MTLSVIILNYKVPYFLEQCIRSVEAATKNMESEIIVVDNNSEDESCDMVKRLFPKVILIENKENVGFSKANNQGVARAKGEYICILNPDTAVTAQTFRDCLSIAHATQDLGALGTYLLDGTGNFLPESKRNLPTPKASLLKLMGFTKTYYAKRLPATSKGPVAVLVGAFMWMKRSVYNEVGGFDEDYFMYGEDIDLSYKISKAGYQNYYAGTIPVLHYKGESTKKDGVYLDRFYGAMSIFYQKHFNTNIFLNAAVNLGVALAKAMKSFQGTRDTATNSSTSTTTLLLTENFSLLKEVSEGTQLTLKSASKAIFQDTLFTDHEFIFDTDYMPYAQIFEVMDQQKNRGNLFRIRPSGCRFYLGSDTSDANGHVVSF